MIRIFLVVLSLAIVVVTAPLGVSAQGQPAGQPQAPRPQGIDLATAKRMMAAAEAQAIAQGSRNATVAIVDALNGDLVTFLRMDGASQVAVLGAEGKARAVLLFGVSTKAIQDSIRSGKPVLVSPSTPFYRLLNIGTNPGGLPVMKDGKMVAAIGAGGGGTVENPDEKIAQAGLDAYSPK